MFEDPDDDYLLSLVQDSTGRRNSKFEHSLLKAKEDLAVAQQEETIAREMLTKAKEQVLMNITINCLCRNLCCIGSTMARQNRS